MNKSIFLPDVITTGKDLYLVNMEESKINYISNKNLVSNLKEFKNKKK